MNFTPHHEISSGRARISYLTAALCVVIVVVIAARAVSFGQDEKRGSREIVSEEFTRSRQPPVKSRPAAKTGGAAPATGKRKQQVYRLASAPAKPAAKKTPAASTSSASPTSSGLKLEQIGITIWRLRPARSSDTGARIPVQDGAREVVLTPERVRADLPLAHGEMVRLSIESPRTGFLYVIDREQYANGKLGEPKLIFPTTRTRSGNNSVGAGVLIDLPAQDDTPPYFTLTSDNPGYVGDLLTVIVTLEPIDEITITRGALALTPEQVGRWEQMWGAETERFELEGGAGAAWTREEQEASAKKGRALTQDEPSPQTIYRVAVKPNSPLLISVPLNGRASY